MNYDEFKETLMEDLKQGIYEQTGKECTISVRLHDCCTYKHHR